MASSPVKLPQGFVLEQPQAQPNLPPGFVLESPAAPQQPQPGFLARTSEAFGLSQHPLDQLGSELTRLKEHPIDTLYETVKTPVIAARDLAYGLVTHPIDTAIGLTGGREFAADMQAGNYKGALGTLAGKGLQVASAKLAPREAPITRVEQLSIKNLPKDAPLVGRVVDGIKDTAENLRPRGAQSKVIPEAAGLPEKAIRGVDKVFRAAAPTGTDVKFTANVYTAAGDLAEIARKVDLAEAKGGIINPDLRPTRFVQAAQDHLQEMYQNERVPVIERNSTVSVDVKLSPDATEGLQFLKRNAGQSSVRTVASKVLQDGKMTVAEANDLSVAANENLLSFESMSNAEQAAALGSKRRMGALKAADTEISKGLNDTLKQQGEPTLYSYERRYAALSRVVRAVDRRANAVMLERKGVIGSVVKPTIGAIANIPKGVASAAQSAVADVNIGKMLQNGLRDLADSGITAKRSGGTKLRPNLNVSARPLVDPSESY